MFARCGCKPLASLSAPLAAAASRRRLCSSNLVLVRCRPALAAATAAGDSPYPIPSLSPLSKQRREKITEPLSQNRNRGAAVARQDRILFFSLKGKKRGCGIYITREALSHAPLILAQLHSLNISKTKEQRESILSHVYKKNRNSTRSNNHSDDGRGAPPPPPSQPAAAPAAAEARRPRPSCRRRPPVVAVVARSA